MALTVPAPQRAALLVCAWLGAAAPVRAQVDPAAADSARREPPPGTLRPERRSPLTVGVGAGYAVGDRSDFDYSAQALLTLADPVDLVLDWHHVPGYNRIAAGVRLIRWEDWLDPYAGAALCWYELSRGALPQAEAVAALLTAGAEFPAPGAELVGVTDARLYAESQLLSRGPVTFVIHAGLRLGFGATPSRPERP